MLLCAQTIHTCQATLETSLTRQADRRALIQPQPVHGLPLIRAHGHPGLGHCWVPMVLRAAGALCSLTWQLPLAAGLQVRLNLGTYSAPLSPPFSSWAPLSCTHCKSEQYLPAHSYPYLWPVVCQACHGWVTMPESWSHGKGTGNSLFSQSWAA